METTSNQIKLLTPVEAAQQLKISTSTAAKWRMTGRGPIYRKLNGRVYYASSDLEAFIESGKRISTWRAA